LARAGEKSFTIEDANIAAFLALKGFKVSPFVKSKDSSNAAIIAWVVDGAKDKISKVVELFYSPDELVSVSEFVKHLKSVRGAMYNLKSINSQ